ncbi:hypothetical protein E2P81_ATG08885 [Venturia nashicola]|uniref:G1/S-specific cyclin pas1 n=1 Tax=Venturia nashicola TaxID=86259 RepID=A0A4Z1NX59_9PEZI|nr:hypothetical protein E6O75_ATG09082 [Venturia nashicola]TLD23541.1 hypothetical protein E2P81_ATG08885 [Venturia nashicola]
MNFDFRLPHVAATSPRTSYPYQSSISSSASSSSSSVFSVDATSSQTSEISNYTSSGSLSVSWDSDDAAKRLPSLKACELAPIIEQRSHPRRSSISIARPPPTLVRQCERKGQFVDCLVGEHNNMEQLMETLLTNPPGDSATQMVQVIWPLSVPNCPGAPATGHGVLPLRTFIQETLRRSRTSFSTLQVALYYLILIKAHVPCYDFTMEQPVDQPSIRALQCGRRMFLAALILASKYLQDRNYSARAWSRISGLKTEEINANEMAFLQAVNWKLHVPEPLFERWQDILIKYTSPPPPSPGSSMLPVLHDWKLIVPILTPALDTVDVVPRKSMRLSPPEARKLFNPSMDICPSPVSAGPPRVLEPTPNMQPTTPSLVRMGPLPTPMMTPQSAISNTPAVSLANYGSRRPSMCAAMSQVQHISNSRSTTEYPWARYNGLEAYQMSNRRPSVQSSSGSSSSSSPESMVSDNSSRSSRASSISSASSVTSANAWAPTSVKLARLATLRCAGLPCPGQQQMSNKNFEPVGSITLEPLCAEPASSPDLNILRMSDAGLATPLSIREKDFIESESPSKGRKRGRSSVDLSLQQNVRNFLGNNARSYLADASNCVIKDDAVAQPSYFLQSPCPQTPSVFGPKALQSPARSVPERRLPVQKDLGRKRACCASEANNIMRFPHGGPGMWAGIL